MNGSTLVPRQEMSDLDWLARNVHEWKSGYDLAVVQRGGGEIYVTWPSVCSSGITKKQWLARRAELQNKPSWKNAPEWAKWLAQDEDGELFWYENEPKLSECLFSYAGGKVKYISTEKILGDWRDTLEKRPEQAEFEPFVSIEDNQEKEMKQDNGWFERGELPPVGCVCQFFSGGYDSDWFDWCIFHGLASCGGFIIEHHHRTSPEMVTVGLFNPSLTKFRPIRTERDVLIEMLADMDGSPATAGKVADAILAAGFSLGAK